MTLTGEEASLNAAGLVSKHEKSLKLFAVKQVAEMMTHHRLTVEDIQEYLLKPSQHAKMRRLRAELFKNNASVVEEEQTDGDSVSDETDGAGAGEGATGEEAQTLKALVSKTQRNRNRKPQG
jgi:hypothetical protein